MYLEADRQTNAMRGLEYALVHVGIIDLELRDTGLQVEPHSRRKVVQ
jgi:hypothetical protein